MTTNARAELADVERVAVAIFRADEHRSGAWQVRSEAVRDNYRDMAKAALFAFRGRGEAGALLESCIADIGTDEPFVIEFGEPEFLGAQIGTTTGLSCTQLSVWLRTRGDHPVVMRHRSTAHATGFAECLEAAAAWCQKTGEAIVGTGEYDVAQRTAFEVADQAIRALKPSTDPA